MENTKSKITILPLSDPDIVEVLPLSDPDTVEVLPLSDPDTVEVLPLSDSDTVERVIAKFPNLKLRIGNTVFHLDKQTMSMFDYFTVMFQSDVGSSNDIYYIKPVAEIRFYENLLEDVYSKNNNIRYNVEDYMRFLVILHEWCVDDTHVKIQDIFIRLKIALKRYSNINLRNNMVRLTHLLTNYYPSFITELKTIIIPKILYERLKKLVGPHSHFNITEEESRTFFREINGIPGMEYFITLLLKDSIDFKKS